MDTDAQHLRLLAIFHYIVGALAVLGGCFYGIFPAMGIAIVTGKFAEIAPPQQPPPEFFGWMLIIMGIAFMAATWGLGCCLFFVGRNLARRQGYWFCFVVACLECTFAPLGTVLGIFTIIVLVRPRVKTLFGLPPENSDLDNQGSC